MNEATKTKTVSKRKTNNRKKGDHNATNPERTSKSNPSITSLYTSNPQLVKDAGSLAFAQSLGTSLSMTSHANITLASNLSLPPVYMPGIGIINLRPSYGGSADPVSPLNMAARKIYSFVRHANSGRSNYESSDLMIYLLQMNEILKIYSWAKRMYGIAMLYNDKNRFYPRGIIEPLGMIFDHLIQNLAEFRYGLNAFAIKLNSLNIPLNMALFTESLSLYSSLFLDGEDAKAQTYVFTPSDYYQYDATGVNTGGSLKLVRFEPSDPTIAKKTVTQILTLLNSMLDPVLQDEDMNIMSGDILKAYGEGSMLKLQPIAEDFITIPVFDKDILAQIENATVTYSPNLTTAQREAMRISQENQQLYLRSFYSGEDPTFTLSKVISSRNDNPSPEEVLNMTRFAFMAPVTSTTSIGTSSFRYFNHDGAVTGTLPLISGTHIVTSIDIVQLRNGNPVIHAGMGVAPVAVYDVVDPEYADFALREMAYSSLTLGSNFNFFPIRPTYEVKTTNGRYTITGFTGDIQNYTVLSYEDLKKIHETALLSLFGI